MKNLPDKITISTFLKAFQNSQLIQTTNIKDFVIDKSLNFIYISDNGIGLAACKKIIEKHNGLIEAESRIQEGTIFKISFPK